MYLFGAGNQQAILLWCLFGVLVFYSPVDAQGASWLGGMAKRLLDSAGFETNEFEDRLPEWATGRVQFSEEALHIKEGLSSMYFVNLRTKPNGTVYIAASVEAKGQSSHFALRIQPQLISFTADNWFQKQEVTVEATNDYVRAPDVSEFEISHRVTSTDGHYDDLGGTGSVDFSPARSLAVFVEDNDVGKF